MSKRSGELSSQLRRPDFGRAVLQEREKDMTMVRSSLSLASLLTFTFVVLVHAQTGFLSIDCGIADDFNYTDDKNHKFYTSDAKFIDTGTNKEISSEYNILTLQRQYRHLRSFPDGDRNCYTLRPVVKSSRYLLRASFMYGNYDRQNEPPKFDVYVGVNRWNVYLPLSSDNKKENEMIVFSTMDYLSVCLVNTGEGIPFISILELNLLDNSIYEAANESQSLRLYSRNHHRPSGQIRYPDDPYDRIWSPWLVGWKPITTCFPINLGEDIGYQPPQLVMNTTVIPYDPSYNISFYFPQSQIDPRFQYHVFMYFAELEQLQSNESREFNIYMDGDLAYGPFSPEYLSAVTKFAVSPAGIRDQHVIDLCKTTSSTLPPILNAAEVFLVQPLSATPTDLKDVEAITNIKTTYTIRRNWMGDPCIPKKYIWEGLNCSNPDSKPPTIISLDLSSSGLTGEISPLLANLTSIQSLDVSNNSLTGPVPNFLTELPSLKFLNLSNNNLTGTIPLGLQERSKNRSLSLSIGNNPHLIGSSVVPDNNNTNPCQGGSCKRHHKIVAPVLASVISTLVLLTIGVFLLRRVDQMRRQRDGRFAYAEVISMTNNLKREIGQGGFGTVYHGQMTNGTQVAVKMLSHTPQGSIQFKNEAQLLMRVHHRNLVPLIGYCPKGDKMALIYEYMAEGNLGSHLSGTNSNSKALNWDQRLRIALDVAQGLEYLHNVCQPPIVHRDIKTTNILLNENLEAKIGDFGLSKLFPENSEQTHVSTEVKGTPGYCDPEYHASKHLRQKSDVYSFGVVLLELITGKSAIFRSSVDYEKRKLVDWASPIIAGGDIQAVVDSKLEGDHDANSLWKTAELALKCTKPRALERPTMSNVVADLKDCLRTDSAVERTKSLKIKEEVEMTSAFVPN